VRDALIAGQKTIPTESPEMIMLFRRFRNVGFMSRAIAIWVEADERIASSMRGRRVARPPSWRGGASPGKPGADPRAHHDVNRRLTPLEVGFSSKLGEARVERRRFSKWYCC